MRWGWLIVMWLCAVSVQGQFIDLTLDSMLLVSNFSHTAGKNDQTTEQFFIHIYPPQKHIRIEYDTCQIKYDFFYTQAFQGGDEGAVQLREGETLFIGGPGDVEMVTFSEEEMTMSVLDRNGETYLFGKFYARQGWRDDL